MSASSTTIKTGQDVCLSWCIEIEHNLLCYSCVLNVDSFDLNCCGVRGKPIDVNSITKIT